MDRNAKQLARKFVTKIKYSVKERWMTMDVWDLVHAILKLSINGERNLTRGLSVPHYALGPVPLNAKIMKFYALARKIPVMGVQQKKYVVKQLREHTAVFVLGRNSPGLMVTRQRIQR